MKGLLTRAWHLREWHGKRYLLTHPLNAARFLLLNRETTNFTYDVDNLDELAAFVGRHTDTSAAVARGYIDEILADREFHQMLRRQPAAPNRPARPAKIGRRAGWYALTRIRKPRLVIETGTHDGLGSSVFARALERNATDGAPGRLWTFDIEPDAGWLIPDALRGLVHPVIGDLRSTLPQRVRPLQAGDVGLFLHDSDHTAEFETFEFQTISPKLGPASLVLSDNSHVTDALQRFAQETNGVYEFWKERPRRHPYPGCGIGLVRWTEPTPRTPGPKKLGKLATTFK